MGENIDNAVWQRIRTLLDGIDYTALTLALAELTPEQRSALVTPLRAYVGPSKYQRDTRYDEPGAALVGVAVLPDAKSVVAWLNRNPLRYVGWPDDHAGEWVETVVVPHAFYLLTERGVPWLGELAAQLADRLPRDPDMNSDRFDLTRRLVAHTGVAVPTSPGFVTGWVRSVRPDDLVAELMTHPEYGTVLPHVFDVDEAGSDFGRYRGAWQAAIASATQHDLADRTALLDACLARLARGGKPGAGREFLAAHQALAPADDEIDGRIESYLAILQAPLSTAAAMAQKVLFAAQRRGTLPAASRLELTRASLARPEKKLVKAQLARLRAEPPVDPDERRAVAEVIAASWPGTPADLVRTGIAAIGALGISGPSMRAIADAAAGALPPDLAAELAAAAGLVAAPAPAAAPTPVQLPAPARTPLTPLAGPEEVRAAFEAIPYGDLMHLTTEHLENVVDGLLTAAARDRDALRDLLAPVLYSDRYEWLREPHHDYYDERTLWHAVFDLAIAAIGDRPPVRRSNGYNEWSGPEVVLVERILSLANTDPLPPLSIALPTWTNGAIDPAVLDDRLARARADGWTPPPRELELARLRCADRQPPAPTIRLQVRTVEEKNWENEVTGEVEVVDVHIDHLDPATPDGIWTGLIRSHHGAAHNDGAALCWPALAPHQRELISAVTVRHVVDALDYSSRITEFLPALAEIDGPIGEATALVLGFGICTARADQRAAARRGLVLMCARPEWDPPVFGRVLGELFVRRAVVMKRSFDALRQTAAEGASPALWPALREVVAAVLAAAQPPPGVADLLSLAADLGQQQPEPGSIAGLRPFAERRGSSRQLVEARRLLGVLSR